jgi:NAD(P)-dependent dehydrogenase (short-subunit alcohol dehydrogenase family)
MSLPNLQTYHKKPYEAISPSRPELRQDGRTVVVTGGSSGIGRAIARGYLAAGAALVIILGRRQEILQSAVTGLNQEAETNAYSGSAEGLVCDVYDLASIAKLWQAIGDRQILVGTLVLNASAYGATETILQGGIHKVWSDFEANVRGPLAMTDHFYKQQARAIAKVATKLVRSPMLLEWIVNIRLTVNSISSMFQHVPHTCGRPWVLRDLCMV